MMAKKKAQKKKATPYSPAGVTTYPNKAAFDREVGSRAKAQLAPTLADIRSRRRQELGAHATRTRDIQGYYDYDLAARTAAANRQQEALTGILSAAGVANTDAQAGLSAALRPSADANAAAAAQLGVQVPGVDPEVAKVLSSYGTANQMGLASEFGSYANNAAGDIALTGIGRREAGEREMGENRANLRALDEERTTAMAGMPGLRDAARASMLQEILGNSQNKLAWRQFGENRRSNKAQEDLAEDQFGLAQDQFTESKRARKFDEAQARKQAQLNQDQLDLARDELNAKIDQAGTEEEMAAAEGAAKTFDSAATWLEGYLAPSDADMKYNEAGKKVFSPGKYKQRVNDKKFNEVMDNLTTRFGLSLDAAYRIMETAPIFRKKAQRFRSALPKAGEFTGPH